MKICFYTFTFLPTVGGAELLLDGLADSLTARGHSVTVWAPKIRHKDNRMETRYRLCRYPRPLSKRFGVRQTIPFLIWEYVRRGIDVLHCHGAYPAAYVGAGAKKILNIPMIVRPHGADILPGEWIRRDARLEKRLILSLNSADRVVAQGQSLASEIVSLGVPPDSVEIIHNGVRRNPVPSASKSEPPYLFSMGSLSRKKGYDILLRGFQQLSGEFPHLRLVIAGEGSQRLELIDLAQKLSLTDKVRWLGEISGEKKQKWLCGALAYICPSRREPFSNALLEAMAQGLPIAATTVGGNVEMLENGTSALMVPPENHAALADAIRLILQNEDLRRRLAEGAFRRSDAFDWERMVDRYEHLYQQLAGRTV